MAAALDAMRQELVVGSFVRLYFSLHADGRLTANTSRGFWLICNVNSPWNESRQQFTHPYMTVTSLFAMSAVFGVSIF